MFTHYLKQSVIYVGYLHGMIFVSICQILFVNLLNINLFLYIEQLVTVELEMEVLASLFNVAYLHGRIFVSICQILIVNLLNTNLFLYIEQLVTVKLEVPTVLMP